MYIVKRRNLENFKGLCTEKSWNLYLTLNKILIPPSINCQSNIVDSNYALPSWYSCHKYKKQIAFAVCYLPKNIKQAYKYREIHWKIIMIDVERFNWKSLESSVLIL